MRSVRDGILLFFSIDLTSLLLSSFNFFPFFSLVILFF